MTRPRAYVLCGDGINCDAETAYGLELAGYDSARIHTGDLLSAPERLFEAQLLALPGGFSFGDEIASGKVLALKLAQKLEELLHKYLEKGNLVIGICNGFQVLVQLGLLPDSAPKARRRVSLCHNSSGKFINKWVELSADASHPLFRGLDRIWLPIRHGEGRIALAPGAPAEDAAYVKRSAPLRYQVDVNGSFDRIAALSNDRGNCFGLMPHPEAFVRWSQHPAWTSMSSSPGEARLRSCGREGGSGADGPAEPHGLTILRNSLAILEHAR